MSASVEKMCSTEISQYPNTERKGGGNTGVLPYSVSRSVSSTIIKSVRVWRGGQENVAKPRKGCKSQINIWMYLSQPLY